METTFHDIVPVYEEFEPGKRIITDFKCKHCDKFAGYPERAQLMQGKPCHPAPVKKVRTIDLFWLIPITIAGLFLYVAAYAVIYADEIEAAQARQQIERCEDILNGQR